MRKIIHTSLTTIAAWTEIVATCEDGSAWRVARHEDIRIRHDDRRMPENWTKWEKLPDIPSDSDKNNVEISATPEPEKNTSTCRNCMGNYHAISICDRCRQPKDLDWNV